ncbi:LysE family transporter [Nonomuraea angiospora]|uniref:LysE family translocator n=1 Tax=Nonomuraea angiospora TaxID=46172 RepID=UPI00344B0F2E
MVHLDTGLLVLFLGMDLLLICTPGPDMLYVMARSLGQGRRTGLTAVAGICSGYTVHTILAAAGLAAALRAVSAALPAMRYAGAAYLVFLAIKTLASLRNPATPVWARPRSPPAGCCGRACSRPCSTRRACCSTCR